jgi:hypothetical protein
MTEVMKNTSIRNETLVQPNREMVSRSFDVAPWTAISLIASVLIRCINRFF